MFSISRASPSRSLLRIFTLSLMWTSLYAHLVMQDPKPLGIDHEGGPDFYNAPLKSDGSDYPCKGFHLTAGMGLPEKQWKAGSIETFTIDMRAVAAHNGGSCQVSISYDFGKTFRTLKSFIGNCPRGAVENQLTTSNQTFEFWIPPGTPGGSAIFAWTWFTVTGFREMYMNCAHVEIIDGGDGLPEEYPNMFIGEINQCKSQEFSNLEFPNPGPQIEYGGSRWVDAGPVGQCNDPPQIPEKAMLPTYKPRGRRTHSFTSAENKV